MLLLVTNLHEKKHDRKSGQTKFWQHMHYFQFALWCYNFALVLQYCICVTWKMHTIFSLIYNFFMYITRKKNGDFWSYQICYLICPLEKKLSFVSMWYYFGIVFTSQISFWKWWLNYKRTYSRYEFLSVMTLH